MRRIRTLLLGGLVGPLFFATAVIVGSSMRPGYDHRMEVMSALGGTGSPNAIVMNGFGFLPAGVMILGFGFALFRFAPRSFFAVVGGVLLGLFGSGIVAAGVYSCDPGCVGTGTSREAFLHIVASVVAFLSGILACFVWGGAFRADPAWRGLSNFSFAAGILSSGLLVAFNSTSGSDAIPGVWQRLFIASLFGWCAVVGVGAFRLTSNAPVPGESGGVR